MASSHTGIPKDANTMAAILKDVGVPEYDPRVVSQMLEFSYRYVSDILKDAQVFSEHAEKKVVDAEDIQLAIQNRVETTFSRPPPREFVLNLAKEKNSASFPPIKQQYGLRLPPDRYCLLQPNYRLKIQYPSVGLSTPVGPSNATFPPVGSVAEGSSSSLAGSAEEEKTVASGSSRAAVGGGVFKLITEEEMKPASNKRKRDCLDEDYDEI